VLDEESQILIGDHIMKRLLLAAVETTTVRAVRRGQPCVTWVGTFHEVRSGELNLVTINSGRRAGEVHLNDVIAGFIEFIPDDTTLPTCSGTYREKLTGVLMEISFGDDQERISQFRPRGELVGTDESGLHWPCPAR